jgi:ADP-heptose:LPS heptosyltransferase/SAM-dependent methyltransferase
MHETSKAVQRRLHDSNFITRYFRGYGIDIGSGNDPLGQYIELFPLMKDCRSWDRDQGDAQTMPNIADETFDFVHSSHCLEDMDDPQVALESWFRILKPGGYLTVIVPDEDMYEQGVFPSTFNVDHKWTFTILKDKSWHDKSVNLVSMIETIRSAELIKIEKLTATYRFGLPRQDQTHSPIGEAAIEFVVRRRFSSIHSLGMNRADRYEWHPDFKNAAPRSVQELPTCSPQIAAKYKTQPKIALHRPGAIGDIIMTLCLVPLLKRKYPEHEIHYLCHPTMAGLGRLMKSVGIDRMVDCSVLGDLDPRYKFYDKVFNLIGYPLHEGYPEKPMGKHLIKYFADEMGVELSRSPIIDIPPTIPHLNLDIGSRPPDLPARYATIHPQAGWSVYKNWPHERWEEVIAKCPEIPFFQIGSGLDKKLIGADHRFMGPPLDRSIDLMAHAALHVGVDSWTNHLTNIRWNRKGDGFTPAVILWGSTQASAAGYPRNTNISLGLPCQPCFREDPKISRMPRGPCINPPGQDYDHPRHACMAGISVIDVITAIEGKWT